MSTLNRNLTDRDERLGQAISACLQSMESGRYEELADWQARYPDFAPELAEFYAIHRQVEQLAAPLRDITRGVADAVSSTATAVERARLSPAAVEALADKFELLDVIGHGGMGVVYKARQKSLNRLVALKVVRATLAEPTLDDRRSQAEAETAALLDHPNIVPVYEVGEADGCTYFSMKLIDGGSLADHLGRFTKEPRAAAQLLVTIARAVYHAHQRGILHRDLKPSNILLQKTACSQHSVASRNDSNSPPTDYCLLTTVYCPYVTDFGLAKRLSDDGSLTQTGAIVGTPTYMAPEQALGKKGSVTTATDVYGLGAVLYTALTGRAPFRSDTPLATLAQVVEADPESPRSLNLLVDRDLETVCLKCLEKEPIRRYGTAEALAQDLERWSRGEPVEARPVGRLAHAWRWCRRKPLLAGLTALVSCLLMVGVAGLAIGFVVVSHARQSAEEQRALLRQRLYPAEISRAHRLWTLGNLDEMAAVLAQFEPVPGEEDLRGFEWHFLQQLVHRSQVKARFTYEGHAGDVYWATFAPDGKSIASAGKDGTIQLCDARTGSHQKTLRGHASEANGLDFSPDGLTLASTSDDETIRLWDLKHLPGCAILPGHKGEVGTAIFSPDGKTLVSGGDDGIIRIWEVGTRVILRQWKAHANRINAVVFSTDGRTLASCSNDGRAKLWETQTGRLSHEFHIGYHVHGITFSPDGRLVATTDSLGRAQLWDTVKGSLTRILDAPFDDRVDSCQFSANGQYLMVGAGRGLVRFWSITDGSVVNQFQAHTDRIWCARFSPDDKSIVTASRDGKVKIWDLPELGLIRSLGRHSLPAFDVAFSPTGTNLAVNSDHVRLWDLVHPSPRPALDLPGTGPFCFAPNDWNSAVVTQSGSLTLVDLKDGRIQAVRAPPDGPAPLSLTFRPELSEVASYDADGGLRLWNPATGRVQLVGKMKPEADFSFILPGTRRFSLVVANGTSVSFWDGAEPLHVIEQAFPTRIAAAAASPDDQLLALGGHAGHLRLLDTRTGRNVGRLFGHTDEVRGLAFSPDGRTLASACCDGTVRLWHVATRQELFTLEARPERVWSVAFSVDGKMLAVGSDPSKEGDAVRVWSVGWEDIR